MHSKFLKLFFNTLKITLKRKWFIIDGMCHNLRKQNNSNALCREYIFLNFIKRNKTSGKVEKQFWPFRIPKNQPSTFFSNKIRVTFVSNNNFNFGSFRKFRSGKSKNHYDSGELAITALKPRCFLDLWHFVQYNFISFFNTELFFCTFKN